MDITVTTYLIYLVITVPLTVWVGRTLYRNGRFFLLDVFKGDEALAAAVNHLLVVGFYLLNLGIVSLALKLSDPPQNAQQSIEALSAKVGLVAVTLGVVHLFNLYVLNTLRRRAGTPEVLRRVAGAPDPIWGAPPA
jgi:hypothetical protein